METNRQELEEYEQIEFSVVRTEGDVENEFKVYSKEELLERLEEVLPGKFGFSLIFGLDSKEKGI